MKKRRIYQKHITLIT